MKIIATLSSAALLFAILGCAGPGDSARGSSAPDEEAQTVDDGETAIHTMDFESGVVSEEPETETTDEPIDEPEEGESEAQTP